MSTRDEHRLQIMRDRRREQERRLRAATCDCAACTLRRTLQAGGFGKKLADGMVEIRLDELGLTPDSIKGLSPDELLDRVLQAASGGAPASGPKH